MICKFVLKFVQVATKNLFRTVCYYKNIECRENLLTNPEILRILETVKFHEQK